MKYQEALVQSGSRAGTVFLNLSDANVVIFVHFCVVLSCFFRMRLPSHSVCEVCLWGRVGGIFCCIVRGGVLVDTAKYYWWMPPTSTGHSRDHYSSERGAVVVTGIVCAVGWG